MRGRQGQIFEPKLLKTRILIYSSSTLGGVDYVWVEMNLDNDYYDYENLAANCLPCLSTAILA